MTSAINYVAVNTSYPVPGIDNDSQGFRDNFSAISNALSVAKTELTALQTNSVLKSTLSGTPTPVNNDLFGSTLSNGLYNNMSGAVYGTVTVLSASVVDVDITNGPLQIYALNGNATLRFISWPGSNKYSKIRLHIKSTGTIAVPAGTVISGVAITGTSGQFSCSSTTLTAGMIVAVNGSLSGAGIGSITSYSNGTSYRISTTNGSTTFTLTTIDSAAIVTGAGTTTGLTFTLGNIFPTLGTENGGTLVYATGFPSLMLSPTGKHKVIDVWSFDDGANVFVSYIGEF